jgi:prepilin signal peptidase PulO-like enzyme (type II secretory pathway)
MMPEWFFVSVVLVFGLVIGSFLDVFAYRFHTGRSLNDRSHCSSCGTVLRWYELFPIISYVTLRGRCRTCQSFIPYRLVLVEILTAGLFLLAYQQGTDIFSFLLLTVFLSVLVVIFIYDLHHLIIPDELSLALVALAGLIGLWKSWLSGEWMSLVFLALGGLVGFIFFASLWYFSEGRWLGLGDAKLTVGLGAMVGLEGLFSLIVWSFWIGAALSLLVILWQHLHIRREKGTWPSVTMKSEVPFAPFLIVSFLLVYFLDADILGLLDALYGNY